MKEFTIVFGAVLAGFLFARALYLGYANWTYLPSTDPACQSNVSLAKEAVRRSSTGEMGAFDILYCPNLAKK